LEGAEYSILEGDEENSLAERVEYPLPEGTDGAEKGLNIHYRKELMVRSIPRSSKNGWIGFQYDLVQYYHHSSRRMMVVYRKLAHLLDELMIPALRTMSYYIMFISIVLLSYINSI